MASKKTDAKTATKTKQERSDCYHDPERLLKTYRGVRWNLKLSMEHHQQDFEAEYGIDNTTARKELLDSAA